ncbi:hypothetical protein [Shewanella sp. UCD-KL12]|uniref:hypothetical protein n=1 Tax=Shewanella sp. UCD-KL12 TaxID=1917163 RepID=UPI000970EF1C|nr:hypothetical protein [Shewanella sp. UCD-KL12]
MKPPQLLILVIAISLVMSAYLFNFYGDAEQATLAPAPLVTALSKQQSHEPSHDEILIEANVVPQIVDESIEVDEEERVVIRSFNIDSSDKNFQRLYAKYLKESGPFVEAGIVYFYKENDGDPHFIATPPSLNDLMFDDPDQYIELRVAEFNEIDEPYSNNWGGLFELLNVNYHYCKETTCLVRASHDSIAFARDYLEQFQHSHPELDVDFASMSSGDIVLTYSKR